MQTYIHVTRDVQITRVHSKHDNIQSIGIEFGVTESDEVISPQKKMVHCRYDVTSQKY